MLNPFKFYAILLPAKGVELMHFPSKRDVGLGLFIPAAGDHGLWLWRAGTYPLDKGHMMERHFLAGKLRRKA